MQNGQRLGDAANLDILGDFIEAKPGFEEDGPILVRTRIEASLAAWLKYVYCSTVPPFQEWNDTAPMYLAASGSAAATSMNLSPVGLPVSPRSIRVFSPCAAK